MSRTKDDYSPQETARRRDAVIKKMLSTPPKPHSEMKLGKRSGNDIPKKRAKGQEPAGKSK